MAQPSEPMAARPPAAVERRIVSVLFADLVGFTTLSERLDAEDVAAVQDAYFASVRETVERYGGVLEKFIGDAAMAVFGAPATRDDDAERAVRAGLALIGAVEQLGARLGLEAGQLQLRVGVNTGEVVHATDGPDAGRVTGDTVNTAARFQAAAEPNRVLVGELTALAVREAIELTEMGAMSLKGKAEPVRAWQADAVRAQPSRDAALGDLRAPLLGRTDDLARLEARDGGRITVIAPPGVGKSRLVAEAAARAESRGVRVLKARVRPQSATPYEAVAQLLLAAGAADRLSEGLASVPPGRRAVIEREVTALLRPASVDGGAARDVTAERDVRFGAWTQALDGLSAADTVLVIVEDVHWAGADLLAFLDQAASDRRRIVCTARPSLLDSSPDWVAAAEQLELSTLPATDAGALVTALVGDALPEHMVAAIADRSDGNPLFIEELLRTWISVGTLLHGPNGWSLAVDPGAVSLPATVQAIYAAQLDDLPADARLVARRASVAGRRFAEAALEPLELDERRDGLEVLRRRAFVAGPQPDPVAGDVYAYRHALLRDAGYASLARAERARLHTALARWLEETAGEHVAEVAQPIAEHYADAAASVPALGGEGLARAPLERAAADWFERAADAALGMAAPAAAIRLLDRSIELTEPELEVELARRRLRRGDVLADSAELDAGVVDMTAAREALAAHLPHARALYANATYRLAGAYMQQIRFSEAEQLTADGLRALTGLDEPAGTARLMAMHAWSISANGRDDGAGEEARRARELAATLGDRGLEVDVLAHFAATNDELGSVDPGIWAELEERARGVGRWRQAVIAARVRAVMTADTDPAGALVLLDRAAELAEAHGLTEQQGWADLSRAETLMVIGDWDAALEAGERAISLGERNHYERLAFRTWMVALPMLAARRDPSWLPRYERWWEEALPHFPPTPSPYGLVLRAATDLWVARARGDELGKLGVLPETIPAFSNPHFLAAREVVAEALLLAGDVDGATAMAGAGNDADVTALMRSSHALISAWVASARDEADRAAELAREAEESARSVGARWWIARAQAVTDPSAASTP